MVKLIFETLSFSKRYDSKKNEQVRITLLKMFYVDVPMKDFFAIGPLKIIDSHTIEFVDTYEKKAERGFSRLLHENFDKLKNKLTGNDVTYIHTNSGISLIGNVSFGIVYRDSSIIEIKPVTSCNLDCIYCSISEGLSSKKHDFVVEKDYLIEELKKVLDFAKEPMEIHIGVQGEPFLYSDMENLIEDLQKIDLIHTISIDTNATLLNKEKIDRLSTCNKLQINFSLDAIDEDKAKKIAGTSSYSVKHVKEMISYASEKISRVLVAPVLTYGYNEDEMENIILFIKSLKKQPILGIQNFLKYKTGRNVVKQLNWPNFYELLDKLEQKHEIKLRLQKEDFNIRKTATMPKPFCEGDIISAKIKCPGRFENAVIAVAKNRNISVPNCSFKYDKKIKIKLIRDKHNIFVGKLM